MATWSGDDDIEDLHEIREPKLADLTMTQESHASDRESEDSEDEPQALDSHLLADEEHHEIEHEPLDELATVPFVPAPKEPEAEHSEPISLTGLEDSSETAGTPIESPEEAAQRIDAWFRSAKTIEDVTPMSEMQPLDETAFDEPSEFEPKQPKQGAATNATIDLGSAGIDELDLSDDFELEHAAEPEHDVAAWDDSHHMDQLLAEIKDQPPADEFEPVVAIADEEPVHEEVAPAHAEAAEWMPDESLAIKPTAVSRGRSKSVVRTLVMPAVCGLLGLAAGYYALLWLKGPQIDFLDAAKYLPKVMLPASFSSTSAPRQLAVAPTLPPNTNDTPTDEKANEPISTPDDGSKTAETKPTDAPAEKQASFTEPTKTAGADDNRYGAATPPADKAAEPAAFNPPAAAPVNDSKPNESAETVRIAGAPSFSASDLAAALVAAKDAEPGLVNGNLTDGHDVARTKGFSYSILADLAQKATFLALTGEEADKLQQDADNIFRTTLSTPHARDEVSQIVPKWIASPNRRQGGVFLAGTVVGHDKQGSVTEGSVDLGTGQPMPVLLPRAVADKAPAGPVAIVGFIVDKPAERVPGYTGTAPQAVFAAKLIPLQ